MTEISIRDIGVGMIGGVDAGKSSTVGALVTSQHDDGNGKLRSLISRHPHERESGRTSDVVYHSNTFGNNRITFVDLAGHEKYLHTTINGLGSFIPDLLLLCIDKYTPTHRMTREHIGIALRMKIPFAILMTKIDLYEKDITTQSLSLLNQLIRKTSSRKFFEIRQLSEVDIGLQTLQTMTHVPIFRVSNVTRSGFDLLNEFLSRVPKNNNGRFHHPRVFMVDRSYRLKGIGLVVSGFNGGADIAVGDRLLLNGTIEAWVKSIHDDFRNNVKTLPSGTRGCLNLRTVVEKVPPGTILSVEPLPLVSHLTAEVEILTTHSTTITEGYQAVLHCGAVRRPARVINEQVIFRGGMKGMLKFRLLKPAYIEVGQALFFREGKIIGDGEVTEVIT